MLDRARVIDWLRAEVSPQRLDHILGVEQTAQQLGTIHHLDEDKAAAAGLLHDAAKFFAGKKLLTIAQQEAIPLDPILQKVPHLLHADISAVVAQQTFGVQGSDILTGIRCHTLGQPGMSPLACCIFVADAIEPTRGNSPALEKVRQVATQNLPQAVRMVCDESLSYLQQKRKIIHPRMILTRNWALQNETESHQSRTESIH